MIKQFYLQNDNDFIAAVIYSGDINKACAIFVHSYTNWKDEHDYMFCRIAKRLAKEGIFSLLFDMRGHGESSRALEDITFDMMIQDVRQMTEYVKKYICEKFFYVTAGFSARIVMEADDKEESEGFYLLSPVVNVPEKLKELSIKSGETFADALNGCAERKLVETDLTRMGMLVPFIAGEIVSGNILSVADYEKQLRKHPAVVFINSDEQNYADGFFENSFTEKFNEGGILFRSPRTIDKIATMLMESIKAKIKD